MSIFGTRLYLTILKVDRIAEVVRLTICADVRSLHRSAAFIRNYSVEQKLTKETKRQERKGEEVFAIRKVSPNGDPKPSILKS